MPLGYAIYLGRPLATSAAVNRFELLAQSEFAELSPQGIPHHEWNRTLSSEIFQLSG